MTGRTYSRQKCRVPSTRAPSSCWRAQNAADIFSTFTRWRPAAATTLAKGRLFATIVCSVTDCWTIEMCNDVGECSRCCLIYSVVGAFFTVSGWKSAKLCVTLLAMKVLFEAKWAVVVVVCYSSCWFALWVKSFLLLIPWNVTLCSFFVLFSHQYD